MNRARGPLKEPGLSQLKRSIPKLIDLCDPDRVLGYLFGKGVIDKTDKELVKKEITDRGQMSALLVILLNCGPDSFNTIVECFKEAGYPIVMENRETREMKRVRGPLKEPGLSKLKRNIPKLIDQCEADRVLEHLLAKGVIDKEDNEKVEKETTKRNKMSTLLDILLSCGPDSFHTIVECFEKAGYTEIMANLGFPIKPPQPASANVVESYVSEDSNLCTGNVTGRMVAENPVDVKLASGEMKTKFDQLHEKNSLIYSLKKKPRGICVVINNSTFDGNTENLPGNNIDANSLVSLFDQLYFRVERHNNLTASAIRDQIEAYRTRNHSEFDCFVFIVLSHGGIGFVSGTDNGEVNIQEEILNKFDANNCTSLCGKPKLFFIQACSGDARDHGAYPAGATTDGTAALIPTSADVFTATAATHGFVGWTMDGGSYFINAIVSVFKDHACEKNLINLLTLVNKEVQSEKITEKGTGKVCKQSSEFRSTLCKELYFFPGLSE